MKGLLTKDLMILRNQWKTLAMMLFLGIVMAVTVSPGAVIVYLSSLSGMLVLGTLSYDEMDNSRSYLLTLPASRKTYVKEKYLFGFAVVIFATLIGVIACIVMMMLSHEPPQINANEIIVSAGAVFVFVMLLLALEIPLRLKFGSEKAKIALYAMFGILAIGAFLMARYYPDEELSKVELLLASKGFVFLGIPVIVSLIVLWLSSLLSTKILEEKEF